MCSKEVIVVPSTAPCLKGAMTEAAKNENSFLTFDLSKCADAKDNRGVVTPLPAVDDISKRPTIRFILQKSQLSCFAQKFDAVETRLDPFAVIDLSSCP